jgi:hypothetical protein
MNELGRSETAINPAKRSAKSHALGSSNRINNTDKPTIRKTTG